MACWSFFSAVSAFFSVVAVVLIRLMLSKLLNPEYIAAY